MDLQELRREIDLLDQEMIRIFRARMAVAAKIARYKQKNKLPVFMPEREQEKLLAVSELAGPEMAEYTRSLFSTLFELSRDYQHKALRRCGLLGRKLGHSYSPQIHGLLGNDSYTLFEREAEELEAFLRSGEFHGLNVTMPYKKAVIPFLDSLSPIASRLGAVNTIVRMPDGTLYGHNTDYGGFRSMVLRSGWDPKCKKALVLGSGGAARTVQAVLEDMGARVVMISRTGENNYGNLHLHMDAALIVNATPVGMHDPSGSHIDCAPVKLEQFPKLEGVLDLVYNPARTRLLRDARKLGIPAENGLWMLVAQAKEAAELFSGTEIPDSRIPEIHAILSRQMQNIILIGMPGSGKTTVGQLLARKMGREFRDSDAVICRKAGRTIPEIFSESGTSGFRDLERDVLRELGSLSGTVISTGGGCVTREENLAALHQNGILFWLMRSPDKLPTEGRPLSQTGSLEDMYREREPLYRRFADYAVDCNGTAEEAVQTILSLLEEIP